MWSNIKKLNLLAIENNILFGLFFNILSLFRGWIVDFLSNFEIMIKKKQLRIFITVPKSVIPNEGLMV